MSNKNFFERINKIDYVFLHENHYGIYYNKEEVHENTLLARLYLCRFAYFCKKYNIIYPPFYINTYEILGFKSDTDIYDLCDDVVKNSLKGYIWSKNVVEQFLLLSNENKKNEDVNLEKYIRIYEPMIELMEKGIHFEYKERGLEVWDTCYIPISFTKWADQYYNELQKEIAEGRLKLEDVDC